MKETVGIENLISVPETTGSELADNLKTHLLRYPVDLLEHRKICLLYTSVSFHFFPVDVVIAEIDIQGGNRMNTNVERHFAGRLYSQQIFFCFAVPFTISVLGR